MDGDGGTGNPCLASARSSALIGLNPERSQAAATAG